MDKLHFGTAGVPFSAAKRTTEAGVKRIPELGLDSMEMEFVHGVRMKAERAVDVGKIAQDLNVKLTAHGPYYINLASQEQEKRDASVTRIMSTLKVASAAGAVSATFHAAFYTKYSKEECYRIVRDSLQGIRDSAVAEGYDILICPETTGKGSQFGTLEELIALGQEIDGVQPCVDFSHLHARSNGEYNTEKEFRQVLDAIETGLGGAALKQMHMHVSGINYGPKGEKNHLLLPESDFNYKGLMAVLKEYEVCGVVTCESPNLEGDAKLLKETYEQA